MRYITSIEHPSANLFQMISCEVQFQQPILQSKNLTKRIYLLKWGRNIQASETENYSSAIIWGQFFKYYFRLNPGPYLYPIKE